MKLRKATITIEMVVDTDKVDPNDLADDMINDIKCLVGEGISKLDPVEVKLVDIGSKTFS